MKKWKLIAAAVAAALLLAGCGSNNSSGGSGGEWTQLNQHDATETLNAYLDTHKIEYRVVPHQPDGSLEGVDTSAAELPSIDKYPLSVTGHGQINVEIFSSTEKSNVKTSRWLDLVAQKFNDSNVQVDGKSVSISVRPIASGLALDYIKSRKYVPAAYSPSNELWGAMIDSTGLKTQLVEKRLAGNVAGILMKQSKYDEFIQKYKQATMEQFVTAALAGDLKLGHTDPNQSSTGLNIFTQELLQFDSANPLSPAAVEKFKKFQNTVPPVSPTTDEMAKVAAKDILDSMIMEAQAYTTTPGLETGWVFTPAGVRHDSPLYALGNRSPEELSALRKFADFCLTPDSQQSASSLGFNQHSDYAGVTSKFSGAQLFGALDLWKQNKDGGRPVVSVFVIDRSGSMDGDRMTNTKAALMNAAGYINPNSHVGLVSYSSAGKITIDLPIAQFDPKHRAVFVSAVKALETGGGTATSSALLVGLKMMLDYQASVPNAKLRIFVMTDGEQNEGVEQYNPGNTMGIVYGLGIPVYAVGFDIPSDQLRKELAELAALNEGYLIDADEEDVGAKLKGLLRKEL